MKFHTVIEQSGKTATGIVVPPEIVASLGSSKKPAVKITINGYTYRTTVATMSGDYMVPVSADVRAAAGVNGGDEVDVEIELDDQPRVLEVPADFAAALDAEPKAKGFFETLSYSNKRRFTYQLDEAKTPETRQRRIEKFVAMLREGKI